jgi:hypothetical protein
MDAAKAFPELAGVSIDVRRKHIGAMMTARPTLRIYFLEYGIQLICNLYYRQARHEY